jgi:hypothetical protein
LLSVKEIARRGKMKTQKIRVKNKFGFRERRAKIIELESIWGMKMLNIVRQFDMAYGKLKGLWSESGGISEEEAMVLRDNALNAIREFSEFMKLFSERVGITYYPPKGLRNERDNI